MITTEWSTIRMLKREEIEEKNGEKTKLKVSFYYFYSLLPSNERSEWNEWKQDWCEHVNFLTRLFHFRSSFSCSIFLFSIFDWKINNYNRKLVLFLINFLLFVLQVRLESIGAEDICDGNQRLILGLLWTIILRFQIQEIEIDVVSVYNYIIGSDESNEQTIIDFWINWHFGWKYSMFNQSRVSQRKKNSWLVAAKSIFIESMMTQWMFRSGIQSFLNDICDIWSHTHWRRWRKKIS